MAIRTELLENGTYNIYTPYSKTFVSRIKGIGGARWNREAKAWNIPGAALDSARMMMEECFGESDIPTEQKMITIRLTFEEECRETCGAVEAFGRTLARAFGRDTGAKVGDGVILEKGEIRSGGSAKNWQTVIEKGSVFRFTVPELIYLREKDDWHVEVIEGTENDKRAALIAEREKLLTRLSEIEKELKIVSE